MFFRKRWCLLLLSSAWIAGVLPAMAEDSGNQTAEVESKDLALANNVAEIKLLIRQLSAKDYASRRQAFLELWERGSQAIPIVKQARSAKSSEDLQLYKTLSALEPLLLAGVSQAEVGSDVYDLLLEPTIDKVAILCNRGLWDLAMEVLKDNPKLVSDLSTAGGLYVSNRFVRTAEQQGDPTLAWPIVHLTQQEFEAAGDSRVWIAQRLGLELPNSLNPDQKALQLLYAGNKDQALEAKASPNVRRQILTRTGSWDRLPSNPKMILGERQGLAFEASLAILYEFAGDHHKSDEIWGKLLIQVGSSDSDSDLSAEAQHALKLLEDAPGFDRNRLMYALLLAGKVAPLAENLRSIDMTSYAEFVAAGSDYRGLFELNGLELDLSNFDDWMLAQTPTVENEARLPISNGPVFRRLSRLCSILIGLGFKEEAERLLVVLTVNADTKNRLWQHILFWMGQSEQRVLLQQVIENQLSQLPTEIQSLILSRLYPEFPQSVKTLLSTAPKLNGTMNSTGRFALLDRLQAWDTQYFDEQNVSVAEWLFRAQKKMIVTKGNQYGVRAGELSELARLARGCGQQELALEFAQYSLSAMGVRQPSPSQRKVEAEILIERGQAQVASEKLGFIRSSADSSMLLLEEQAALLAGDHEKAIRLNRMRWLLPLSYNSEYQTRPSYGSVAQELMDEGDLATAFQYFQVAWLLSPYGGIDVYDNGRSIATLYEEDGKFQQSADALRAPLVEALFPESSLVDLYIARGFFHSLRFTAQRERLHRAVACIEAGDFDSAMRHAKVGEKLQPQDIEMVVQCYPRLRDAGQTEFAEQLFSTFEKSMLAQLEVWPNDTTAQNNLAWMYAKCQRKLDEAYVMSQKAVSGAPNSHVYLDTLAEVHFRAGRLEAAIIAAKQCIRMDPREKHYRDNLKKFLRQQGR